MHIIHAAKESFIQQSALWLADAIRIGTSHGQRMIIGLSGGKTPQPIYEELSNVTDLDWSLVTFFLVDERYVAADHPESNQHMIKKALWRAIECRSTLIAPETALPIDKCISAYERALTGLFSRSSNLPLYPSISTLSDRRNSHHVRHSDNPHVVILGLGLDGHIASLFPPLSSATRGSSMVVHTTTDHFTVRDRISVTLPVLQAATNRLFLITGPEKALLLRSMQSSPIDVDRYPAQALFDDRTTWICDDGK